MRVPLSAKLSDIEAGVDLNRMLPALAAYMGQVELGTIPVHDPTKVSKGFGQTWSDAGKRPVVFRS